MCSTLAIAMCIISKSKTFLQTYPVEIMQIVFVVLALPCRAKPQGESPGFPMNLHFLWILRFLADLLFFCGFAEFLHVCNFLHICRIFAYFQINTDPYVQIVAFCRFFADFTFFADLQIFCIFADNMHICSFMCIVKNGGG